MRARKLFWINSADRVGGTNSAFQFRLDIPKDAKYDSVFVVDATIPKSYYLAQSGYNTFQLTESSQTVTVTIPVGSYSSRSLRTVLQTLLNAASPHLWTYTVAFPSSLTGAQTAKYTYTVSGNGNSQPTFTFVANSTIYEIMGFNDLSSNAFVANTLVSANVLKLALEDCVYIHSDLCRQDDSDVLQHVYVSDAPDYSSISYKQNAWRANSKTLTDRNSNIFRVSLTSEAGIPIDLNGLNWNMCICVYERESIFDILREAVKLYFMRNS